MCHAQERLLERYRIEATPEELGGLAFQIHSGKAHRLEDRGRGACEVWEVDFKGQRVRVVYLPRGADQVGWIKTFLPKNPKRWSPKNREYAQSLTQREARVRHQAKKRALVERDLDGGMEDWA